MKEARGKEPCIVRFHLYERFRISKSLEGRLAVARRWVQRSRGMDGDTGGTVALQRGSLADPTPTQQAVTTTTDTPWTPLVG